MSGSPTNILNQADSAFQIIDYFPTFAPSVFFHNLIRTVLVVFNNQYRIKRTKHLLKSIPTAKMRGQASNSQQPDFGTYHHSTPRASQNIRQKVKMLFTKVFSNLPFAYDDSLKILDVGCGLGFLSCVCAEYYLEARITGFDTFKHASLKESSLAKTNNNAKTLGFSERIRFQKGDVFSSDYSKGKYDLFVSNLVFHNLARKRINAYEILAHWMMPRSYLILGDLFFDYKTDFRRLTSHFGNVEKINCFNIGRQYKMLVLSDPRK